MGPGGRGLRPPAWPPSFLLLCSPHRAHRATAAPRRATPRTAPRSTPLERLLRARLVYKQPSVSRMVSFEYLNRQLVWQELSDFLLFLLPLVNVARVKRAMLRAFPRLPLLTGGGAAAGAAGARLGWTVAAKAPEPGARGAGGSGAACGGGSGSGAAKQQQLAAAAAAGPGAAGDPQGEEEEDLDPPGPCPICGLREIAVPYAALPCRHVFCYYCLRAHCEADAGFECPVDGRCVLGLQRFDGRREGGG
jgi:peroxin-2